MTDNQQMQDPNGTVTMDVMTFGAKFQNKVSIFRFLSVEAGIYLPHYQTVTIWHLKDLASGDKTVSDSLLVPSPLSCLQSGPSDKFKIYDH